MSKNTGGPAFPEDGERGYAIARRHDQGAREMTKITSDGTTASYYQLPEGCTELQDLISYRNMNAQDGEIFRAIYRKGRASHSDELRDARKVLFYAQAEVRRLEALQTRPIINELYTAHPATPNVWEAGEQRMEQIGLNGNDGEHYMGGKPLEV